jgi:hypothetical protein
MRHVLSIDNYIAQHRGDKPIEVCGKLGIARAILEAEEKSKLRFEERSARPDLSRVEDTWINHFFALLCESCTVEDLAVRFSNLVVVSFNYDRCFEHFMFYALQVVYPTLGAQRAAELVGKIEVFHPYGDVGRLPWQQRRPTDKSPPVEFGQEPSEDVLLALLEKLKTFSESTDPDSEQFKALRERIRSAERIIHLGFAYARQNLHLLYEPKHEANETLCFGSIFRISAANAGAIKDDLMRLGTFNNATVQLADLRCADFVRDYSRLFGFG